MSFVSYAQNFEDVILWRALKNVDIGFYIDVGAQDPDIDSVTKAFYERGWRGINIEPVFQWFEKLKEKRIRDINLNIAIGNKKGEIVLYEIPDTGLSTLCKDIAEKHRTQGYKVIECIVPIDTLTNICLKYHVAPIHFLKIDVEGAEKEVLEGIDFSIIRPWIILIEATIPNTQTEKYQEWEAILLNADYEFVYFDGLNRFYIACEHSELKQYFKTPPNVFDDFISYNLVEATNQISELKSRVNALENQKEELLSVLNNQISELKSRVNALENQKEELLSVLNNQISELQSKVNALWFSKPWRFYQFLGRFKRKVYDFFCFKKLIIKIFKNIYEWLKTKPSLYFRLKGLLDKNPRLKMKLKAIIHSQKETMNNTFLLPQIYSQEEQELIKYLTEREKLIYKRLKKFLQES